MKNHSIKSISQILQNSNLRYVVEKANLLHEMNAKIQTLLPEQYRGLYRIVNLVDNQLTFSVQNATVRQGLWLQQENLLRLIQTDFPQVTELLFKVSPNFNQLNRF